MYTSDGYLSVGSYSRLSRRERSDRENFRGAKVDSWIVEKQNLNRILLPSLAVRFIQKDASGHRYVERFNGRRDRYCKCSVKSLAGGLAQSRAFIAKDQHRRFGQIEVPNRLTIGRGAENLYPAFFALRDKIRQAHARTHSNAEPLTSGTSKNFWVCYVNATFVKPNSVAVKSSYVSNKASEIVG